VRPASRATHERNEKDINGSVRAVQREHRLLREPSGGERRDGHPTCIRWTPFGSQVDERKLAAGSIGGAVFNPQIRIEGQLHWLVAQQLAKINSGSCISTVALDLAGSGPILAWRRAVFHESIAASTETLAR